MIVALVVVGSVVGVAALHEVFRRSTARCNPYQRWERWRGWSSSLAVMGLWPYGIAAAWVGPVKALAAVPISIALIFMVALAVVAYEDAKGKA